MFKVSKDGKQQRGYVFMSVSDRYDVGIIVGYVSNACTQFRRLDPLGFIIFS